MNRLTFASSLLVLWGAANGDSCAFEDATDLNAAQMLQTSGKKGSSKSRKVDEEETLQNVPQLLSPDLMIKIQAVPVYKHSQSTKGNMCGVDSNVGKIYQESVCNVIHHGSCMMTEEHSGPQPGLWHMDDMVKKWPQAEETDPKALCYESYWRGRGYTQKAPRTGLKTGFGECNLANWTIPKGVIVDLIELKGSWGDFCHHQSKNRFWVLNGDTGGHISLTRAIRKKTKKDACAFRFRLEKGYYCQNSQKFRLRNLYDGGKKCLDLSGNDIIVWACHLGENQLWSWGGMPLARVLQSVKKPDYCLTLDGNDVKATRCSGTWNQQVTTTGHGQLKIGQQCLDWDKGSPTHVTVYNCHNNANQRWQIISR